jgi:hypothetical protein
MNKNRQEIIELFEEKLKRYKLQLKKDPNSLFYKGLVKNTQEYIEELKLKQESEEKNEIS